MLKIVNLTICVVQLWNKNIVNRGFFLFVEYLALTFTCLNFNGKYDSILLQNIA